jgi:hypothetical protein
MDTILVSHVVMVKRQVSTGVCARFSEAEWLKNRVKAAKADLGQSCGFRRLSYTPSYKFSALPGWRHGVRSRSLGHALSSPAMADSATLATVQRYGAVIWTQHAHQQ